MHIKARSTGIRVRIFCHLSVPASDLAPWLMPYDLPCSYLHTNGFIHRDIKAANLLIDDDGTVLLGDLGVAASLSEDIPSAEGYYFTMASSSAGASTVTPHSIPE